jgi:hypothetical protein
MVPIGAQKLVMVMSYRNINQVVALGVTTNGFWFDERRAEMVL